MSIAPDMEMGVAFREKMAWISLLTTLLVFGGYGATLVTPGFGRWNGPDAAGLLIVAIIVEIVVISALAIAAAVLSPKEANTPVDEREGPIFARANRWGYGVLSALIWSVLFAGLYQGLDGRTLAMGCLGAMLVSEVVRSGFQIIGYRLGA